jgi:hypothetical protein
MVRGAPRSEPILVSVAVSIGAALLLAVAAITIGIL